MGWAPLIPMISVYVEFLLLFVDCFIYIYICYACLLTLKERFGWCFTWCHPGVVVTGPQGFLPNPRPRCTRRKAHLQNPVLSRLCQPKMLPQRLWGGSTVSVVHGGSSQLASRWFVLPFFFR